MSPRKRKVDIGDADALLARLVKQLRAGGRRGGKEKLRAEPVIRAVSMSEKLTHALLAWPTEFCRRYSTLSPREKQVAPLHACGDHQKQIARKLGIARGTIPTYVRRIVRKVAAESRGLLYLSGLVDEYQRRKRQSRRQPSGAR